IKAVDPAAFLVPPRILRRVIKQHRHLPGLGLLVPHRKCYAIDRDSLLAIVDRDELDLPAGAELPAEVTLLVRPDAERLATRTSEQVLTRSWRLLFHAHVDQHFARLRAEGKLTPTIVRERVRQLGQTEFEEIRTVLWQEHFLLPPLDDVAAYA